MKKRKKNLNGGFDADSKKVTGKVVFAVSLIIILGVGANIALAKN